MVDEPGAHRVLPIGRLPSRPRIPDDAVARYDGDYRLRRFSCWDQFLCLAFAQFTYRESLRDIEACLRASPDKLYHMGIRGRVSRSTLADANEKHDWRIFADFAQILIQRARGLYAGDPFGVELQNSAYAHWTRRRSTCAWRCSRWARFREQKGAVKVHTLIRSTRKHPRVCSGSPMARYMT